MPVDRYRVMVVSKAREWAAAFVGGLIFGGAQLLFVSILNLAFIGWGLAFAAGIIAYRLSIRVNPETV